MQSQVVFEILVILLSVIVHEVMHGYAAYLLGDPTAKLAGRLTLNPLKHLDPVGSVLVPVLTAMAGVPFGWAKPVPFNPYNLRGGKWGPGIVAVAGPFSNYLLAVIFAIILHFSYLFPFGSGIGPELLYGIIWVNVALGTFNLIPVPPLDGSKVLFALLPFRFEKILHSLERYQLILFVFVIFFAGSFLLPVVEFITRHIVF